MKTINFNATKQDKQSIIAISKKAAKNLKIEDILSMQMDITACHLNGTPLDFEKLLAFDEANFGHDIYGIMRHINRQDGTIMNGFLPRCAK